MKRIKQRWDIEFPQKKRTTQTLVDNAKLFGKESLRPEDANIKAQKNMNWTTEMKIKLAKIDEEERNNGWELMKRIEMGLEFPEQASGDAVVQRCSVKKVLLNISQNSQENTCAWVSFFKTVQLF